MQIFRFLCFIPLCRLLLKWTRQYKVQFGGDEYDFAEIKKAVEADYKSKFKGKVKTIEFYIKPEDKAVYYVINGDFSDKIEL